MNLPNEFLGVVAYEANDLRVEPVPLREPAADETVVEVAYGGICGSDLHYWMHGAAGESILRAPMVLGHEVVGTPGHACRGTTSHGIRLTDRTSHRPAPTWVAPPGSRIATGRSSSTPLCPAEC